MDDSPTTVTSGPTQVDDAAEPSVSSFPLVTVVVVAHNPGAWFDEVLRSLAAQDYPTLDLVIVDAASEVPIAETVHEIIPEATVVPLIANQGFAKNANTILDHPTLGPYLVVCHDDVALAPDCIRRLMEEALRSNAGVVGPKLLDWNDPNRILHVGLGADKTGLVSDLAEPGEYDQEQHDAVRDVFAVPGAVTLLRTDLFRALQGFDPGITVQGEDLDLCWRAHVLGARVLVNPAATARHREDLSTRIVGHDRDQFARRHRIRSMLSNYGPWHTIRVVPQALVASLINAVIALFQGRLGLIVDIVTAWTWNLRRAPSIMRRRRELAKVRQIHDSEVRALQLPGFEGIAAWRKERADRRADEARYDTAAEVVAAASERRRWAQAAVLIWIGVAAVLIFGSRGLLFDQLPIFNEFTRLPDGPSPLLSEWGTTWRSTGVGGEAPPSLLHLAFGFGGIALFGQMGLLRLLVTLGLIVVGAVGIYRLLAPFRSPPAQLVALIVYIAAPLPYNAIHSGSWSGLIAYGAMPWIARRLAIAAGMPPFGDDETTVVRRLGDTAIVAIIIAAAALIEPFIAVALGLLVVGWTLGSLATRRTAGIGRLFVAAVVSVAIAFVLLMPASLGLVLGNADWSIVGGTGSVSPQVFELDELARMATGPHGQSAVGWALLVVPALSLVIAFGQRLAWAARSWFVAAGSIGLAWAGQNGTFDVPLADAHVLLAPAALAFALAAGMTAAAFGRDLKRYSFGWRQLVPIAAVIALILSVGAGLGGAIDGRWEVVEDGYEDVFGFLDQKAPAHARAFWLGDADVLPVEGWQYDDRLSYSITQARTPTILDRAVGNPDDTTETVRDIFGDTLNGASSRLGQRLAVYGIRYIIVVESNAPAPFGTIERQVDPVISERLTEQLDLVRVEVRSGATIYENRAYVPTVSQFPPGSIAGPDDTDRAPGMSSQFELALPEVTSLRSYRGNLAPGDLYLAAPSSDRWSLQVNGSSVNRQEALDWANVFRVEQAGPAQLTHSNVNGYWFAAIGQLLGWIILLTALILGRRRRS